MIRCWTRSVDALRCAALAAREVSPENALATIVY